MLRPTTRVIPLSESAEQGSGSLAAGADLGSLYALLPLPRAGVHQPLRVNSHGAARVKPPNITTLKPQQVLDRLVKHASNQSRSQATVSAQDLKKTSTLSRANELPGAASTSMTREQRIQLFFKIVTAFVLAFCVVGIIVSLADAVFYNQMYKYTQAAFVIAANNSGADNTASKELIVMSGTVKLLQVSSLAQKLLLVCPNLNPPPGGRAILPALLRR